MRLPSIPVLLFGILVWGYTLATVWTEDAAPVIELPATVGQAVTKYEEAETKAKAEYQAAEAKAKAALLKSLEAEEAKATKGGKLDLALALRALRAKHDPSIGEVTGAPRTNLEAQEQLRRLQGDWQVLLGRNIHVWSVGPKEITLKKLISSGVTDVNQTFALSEVNGAVSFIYATVGRAPTQYKTSILSDGDNIYMKLYSIPENIEAFSGVMTRIEQQVTPSKSAR